MGGKKGKKSKKSKTKAQKAATARHAKFKQTRVQTFGGKRKSFSKKEETRIKKAGYSVDGYSKAAPNKASGYSGTTGVSVGSKIKNPNPKVSGVGPVVDGKEYASMLKVNPPKLPDGTKVASHDKPLFKSVPARLDEPASDFYKKGLLQQNINPAKPGDLYGIGTKTAMLGGDYGGSKIGVGLVGAGALTMPSFIRGALDMREGIKKIQEKRLNTDPENQNQSSLGTGGNLVSSLANQAMGIRPVSAITMKSPDSFGYPSQDAVDKAAGITAGGLNIGGSGFTPSNPSGGTTSRAIRDMTSEQLADRYEASLNPNSFKGLSDGETRGVGPVASGRAYAAGLNVDNKNVENRIRSAFNAIPLVPNVRRLPDKEIADNRISAQKKLAYRNEMAKFRGGGGGGARLPVAPLTPEEILLPEETAVAQTGPDYQQAQTGLDPNRLLQIQQEAYQQAFNPYNPLTVGGFNPFFRFFGRRAGGMGRGAFRRAFRRD